MKKSIELENFEEKYNSVLQLHALLADTQHLIGEIGRGAGKTTEILAPRLVRISYSLRGAILLLAGATYTFILETIVPGMITYLAKNYTRGIQYEYGKRPPKHFQEPIGEVKRWEHTISFAWGTVIQFVSVDRPESSIGKSAAHVFCDEMLRISEINFVERIIPTLRGDRQIFGKSPYFMGITGFSSTPNFETDHDWWLNYENNMDKKKVSEIKYAAYRVLISKYQYAKYKQQNNTAAAEAELRFINRWNEKLNIKRKGVTYYMKGSSFTNLLILSLDYMKNQLEGSKSNLDKFNLSILGIRPKQVKDRFVGRFDKRHVYDDSYKYNTFQIDSYIIDGQYQHTSRDLKYCDPNRPIIAGWDPGHFMSIVFGQQHGRELRMFKNMYVISPQQHEELALQINDFFKNHNRKTIYLHYDRAGNQRNPKYNKNPKGETDAAILKTELTKLGWTVRLMSLGKRTIFYWEHYILYNIIFAEKDKNTPRIRICQHECEELISSINMSPVKRSDGIIELDKSSEKKLEYSEQAFWSPQLFTAATYMWFGLYEKHLPNKAGVRSYAGL